MRATRLTYSVILEMLSWIKDYSLFRKFEVGERRGVYLHATKGVQPNIVARRGQDDIGSSFKLVVVSAAKNRAPLGHHRFAITPAHCEPRNDDCSFYFLTVNPEGEGAILLSDTPANESTFSLSRKGKTGRFKLTSALASSASLAVRPSKRKLCECGCITQDDVVGFHPTENSSFSLHPQIKGLYF